MRLSTDRDYLWLRAHEKSDSSSISRLRRVDPEIEGRVRDFMSRLAGLVPEDVRHDQTALYSWLQDRYADEYAGTPTALPCECAICVARART